MQRLEYLTVAQAAEETGLSKASIYKAIKSGDLAKTAPNGCSRGWRIRRKTLDRWLAACETRG